MLLIIRDDKSIDNTNEIIQKYNQLTLNRFQILTSNKNLGIKKNFSELIKATSSEYIFFADQDDIWLPDKIQLTLEKIRNLETLYGKNTPLLVHTDLKVVDSNMNLISDSFWRYQNLNPDDSYSLSRLLVQNVVTGCTMAINSALRNIFIYQFLMKQLCMIGG